MRRASVPHQLSSEVKVTRTSQTAKVNTNTPTTINTMPKRRERFPLLRRRNGTVLTLHDVPELHHVLVVTPLVALGP